MEIPDICTDPNNPCSCTSGPYQAVFPLCKFLSSNSSVQAEMYKIGIVGRPSIESKYIKRTLLNNTMNHTYNYSIDLTKLGNQFKPFISYMDETLLQSLQLAVLIIFCLISFMIIIHQSIKWLKCKTTMTRFESIRSSRQRSDIIKSSEAAKMLGKYVYYLFLENLFIFLVLF